MLNLTALHNIEDTPKDFYRYFSKGKDCYSERNKKKTDYYL